MKYFSRSPLSAVISFSLLLSCATKNSTPSKELISQINLKRGELISCGVSNTKFGTLEFEMSCSAEEKKDFNLAVELLHSFEYDEAEKVFAEIIDKTPECAMAYWGVAMSNFHPLWTPPTIPELQKGAKAIEVATSIVNKSARETAYIDAIGAFYHDWQKLDHHTRCLNFENAMENLHKAYPADKESAIFYALALDAAAEPTDLTYEKQKKAGSILSTLYPGAPDHPGIIHYIIHTYDYPGLAVLALPAARKYASVAPSSSHALHMPSHIFTRLGLWDECIKSNLMSVSAAKCYAESAGFKGHWDEEYHGLDYLVYAYLQKGENELAKDQLKYLQTITEAYPVNFKVAYAFAAIPSRIVLENKKWPEAASLSLYPTDFPWKKFPWQEAIVHFTRLLGAVHSDQLDSSRSELTKLNLLRNALLKEKDFYKAHQVEVQIKTGEAWIEFMSGDKNRASHLMELASNMEDSTEKHPVTPGEVIPARELWGDMLMQMREYENALQAYEAVLQKSPNRFNSLYNAGRAAEKSGNREKAAYYYKQLEAVTNSTTPDRAELVAARSFVAK